MDFQSDKFSRCYYRSTSVPDKVEKHKGHYFVNPFDNYCKFIICNIYMKILGLKS